MIRYRDISAASWLDQALRWQQIIVRHADRAPPPSSKMTVVEEECDESAFWIEMLVDTGTVRKELVADLLDEADQLVSIFVSSINTARKRKR